MNKSQILLAQLSARIEAEKSVLLLMGHILDDCRIICNDQIEILRLCRALQNAENDTISANERTQRAGQLAAAYETELQVYKRKYEEHTKILYRLENYLAEFEEKEKTRKAKLADAIYLRKTPDNFAPDITAEQITAIYNGLPTDFNATKEQITAIFARPVNMPKPIETTPGRAAAFLDSLHAAGFIEAAQYAAIAEKRKCFIYNSNTMSAKQLRGAKNTNKASAKTSDFDYIKDIAKQ